MPPCGSMPAVPANPPANTSRGRSPRRSTTTMRSNGRRRSRGATARSGFSAFPISPSMWFVANLRPRSLKAIIPWEGFADLYRDALYHGGSLFMTNWYTAHLLHHLLGRAAQHVADGWQVNTLHFWLHNSLDSGA